jgi:hypothetical protein
MPMIVIAAPSDAVTQYPLSKDSSSEAEAGPGGT